MKEPKKKGDARFAAVSSDPRFRKAGRKKQKVRVDERFQHMFTDPAFTSVNFVDSRGRVEKVVRKERLERFYDVEKEDSGEDEEEEEVGEEEEEGEVDEVGVEDDEDEDEDEVEEDEVEEEEEEVSDSSDGESSADEEEQEGGMFDAWDEVNTCVETISESTPRLSICNLNWDRVTATDIFVMCQSCLPAGGGGGRLTSVEVYPSQFGKEQMAKERERGPEIAPGEEGEEEGREESAEYSNEALRKYQVERLKYYYAIVTCDGVATADHLYKELDGVEYQLSSSILDLRYVPDEMEFTEESPASTCTSLPNMATYKPPTFTTTALQNSSVKLTWDETDQSRLQLTKRKFDEKDLENVDFSTLIASSESESEGEEEGPSLEKYRALLANEEEGDEGEVDQEMEITWTTGLEDNQEVMEEAQKNEERQKEATLYEPDEKDDFFATDTVLEQTEGKKKKRKKKKKGGEEMTKEASELALLMEEKEDEKKHFNMKKIVSKSAKSAEVDSFQVDLEDDRFAALRSSHHYAIDPAAPEFKSTSQTERLRAAQAAALSAAGEARAGGGGVAESAVEKIKRRAAALEAKKQGSKLYKTKEKREERREVEDVKTEVRKEKKKKKKKLTEEQTTAVAMEQEHVITEEFPKKSKKKKRSEQTEAQVPVVKKKRKTDSEGDGSMKKKKKKKKVPET